MRALIDLDSLFFKAVYKVVSLTEIKGYYLAGWSREDIEKEIIDSSLHRLDNLVIHILDEIELTGVKINSIYYFITTCKNSFRKKIAPTYKAKRKRNKYVSELRNKFIETTENVYSSDTHEADDLIACAIDGLDESDYIILTMDKDVKHLKGWHYDYYLDPKEESMRGLGYTSKADHEYFLAYQMLVGDNGDNIKGCKGVGEKTANKILKDKKGYSLIKSVVQTYFKKGHDKEFIRLNYRLLKLGV